MDEGSPGKSVPCASRRWPSAGGFAAPRAVTRPRPGRRVPRALVWAGLCRLDSGVTGGQERGRWAWLPQTGALGRGQAPAPAPLRAPLQLDPRRCCVPGSPCPSGASSPPGTRKPRQAEWGCRCAGPGRQVGGPLCAGGPVQGLCPPRRPQRCHRAGHRPGRHPLSLSRHGDPAPLSPRTDAARPEPWCRACEDPRSPGVAHRSPAGRAA